jgi:hypothetical protein
MLPLHEGNNIIAECNTLNVVFKKTTYRKKLIF